MSSCVHVRVKVLIKFDDVYTCTWPIACGLRGHPPLQKFCCCAFVFVSVGWASNPGKRQTNQLWTKEGFESVKLSLLQLASRNRTRASNGTGEMRGHHSSGCSYRVYAGRQTQLQARRLLPMVVHLAPAPSR